MASLHPLCRWEDAILTRVPSAACGSLVCYSRARQLVRFTVSTAAQHDEQVSRLTLQLEAANKRYAEAQARLKDVGGDGVRRRATGAGATEGKSSDDNGAGGAGTAEPEVRVVRSGFPLWQVIIVAVIMFVLGTIMGQS